MYDGETYKNGQMKLTTHCMFVHMASKQMIQLLSLSIDLFCTNVTASFYK